MKGWAGVIAAVLLLAGGGAARAEAAPYLTFAETGREIGATLHQKFDYGVIGGSLDAYCQRHRRNKVACDFSFWDADYDSWCGYGQVIETQRVYQTRLRGMHRCGD